MARMFPLDDDEKTKQRRAAKRINGQGRDEPEQEESVSQGWGMKEKMKRANKREKIGLKKKKKPGCTSGRSGTKRGSLCCCTPDPKNEKRRGKKRKRKRSIPQ